jgi:hypothetical protein
MSCSWGIDTDNVVLPSTAKEDIEQQIISSRQKSGVTWTTSPEYSKNVLDTTTTKQKSPPKGKSRTIPPALIPPTVTTPVYPPQKQPDRSIRNTPEYQHFFPLSEHRIKRSLARTDDSSVTKGKSPTKPSPVRTDDSSIPKGKSPTKPSPKLITEPPRISSFDNLLDLVVDRKLKNEKHKSQW